MTTSPQPAPEPDGAPSGSSAADPAVTTITKHYKHNILQTTTFILIF